MSFPRYEKYKDSGVEWLGEVPEHWQVMRLRHATLLNPSKSEVADCPGDQEVSFLPMDAIGEDGTLSLDQTRELSTVLSGYTYFRENDVTIAKITPCFENGKGAIMRGLQNKIGFGTTELIVARPLPEHLTSNYIAYLFCSAEFRALGAGEMYGAGGQKRVPDSFVREFKCGIPPIEEQTAIAAFLDHETAKIDALVDEQRRLIELLKEKRQAVISHAVTKGLNPDAPMKDSGVEWLGEVPEHWSVMPLKRVIKSVESGTSVNAMDVPAEEGDLGVLKTSAVYTGTFRPNENKTVDAAELDRVTCPLQLGTLIVSRMNTADLVGAAGYVNDAPQNIFLPDRLWQVHFDNEANAEFVHLRTLSSLYRNQVKAACTGTSSSMKNLGQDDFGGFVLALPPMDEQSEIVIVTLKACAELDNLLKQAESAVFVLQERRTALISAAVTGKIDVRNFVPKTEGAPA